MPGGDLPKLHSEMLQQDGPQGDFPLNSAISMFFLMLESIIFDFHERWWALHSLGGDFKSMGKTFKSTTSYGAFRVSSQTP